MLLARMLTPGDFGTMAIVTAYVALAALFADAGLGAALVQKRGATDAQFSSVFWIHLALGTLASLVIAGTAPWLGAFYENPLLADITPVMSLAVLFGALGAVHVARTSKSLDYRVQALAASISSALAAVVAVLAAAAGWGIWALVAQAVLASLASTCLLWYIHRWRPRRSFAASEIRPLFGFGFHQTSATFLEWGYSRAYAVFLGGGTGSTSVGLYRNAEVLSQVPVLLVGGIASRLALPIFAMTAQDVPRLKRGVQIALRGMMLVHAPVMLLGAALSEPVTELVLGPAWLEAAPMLLAFCIAGSLYPIHMLNVQVLLAIGNTGLMLKLELLKKLIAVSLLLAVARYGVLAIAWAHVAFSLVAVIINCQSVSRSLGYAAVEQMRDAGGPLAAAGLIALAAHFAFAALDAPLLPRTLVIGGGGLLCFAVVAFVLKLEAWRDMLALLRSIRPAASA